MGVHRLMQAAIFAIAASCVLTACGGGAAGGSTPLSLSDAPDAKKVKATPTPVPTVRPSPSVSAQPSPLSGQRPGFVGAFFRPIGSPPFGVFSAQSPGVAPQPYPTPGAVLTGSSGYCGQIASNGYSIVSGYLVDSTKLADITKLGVGWTRMAAPQFFDDGSHIFGAGHYTFGDFDSAQCSTLADHRIQPVIGLEAGPVEYDSTPGQFSPQSYPQYQSAADFGQWCGAVAAHERAAFPSVTKFSLPGNEVNSNPQLFPGGITQIVAYSEACYAAIKAANPNAYVYGFELNMDGSLNAPGFVKQLYTLGCKVGTCYDGIAIHLSLRYPIPAPSTPCYPNPGGDYSMQCVTDIENAAQAPIHVLISESVYPVPGAVPDENVKALAVVAQFKAYASNATVDGVTYANVDECALYPSGYFAGGCLIGTSGQILPAYTALQQLIASQFAF
jgi:hypothetical protein